MVGVAVYELTRSPYLNKFRSPWAVKKLVKKVNRDNTEYRKRLIVESEVLRQLQHPNVVGFRGLWSDTDGEPCLAMEECDSSLGDVIEERLETVSEPFPVDKLHKVSAKCFLKDLSSLSVSNFFFFCFTYLFIYCMCHSIYKYLV